MTQAILQTPTPNIENSRSFYERLDFKVLSENPLVMTDGIAVVEINNERTARAGIKLFKDSWQPEVEALMVMTKVLKTEMGYLLSDTSGTWIYLIEGKAPVDFAPSESSYSVLGNFAGVSLETVDMAGSIEIFEALGFKKTMGGEDQGWIALATSEGFGVSIMKPNACPHLFFNPSFTYFNSGKNPAIIQKVRDLNIPITEEITAFNKEGKVDNIIIRDPGGFGFFVFND